jgi:hypothetical protein
MRRRIAGSRGLRKRSRGRRNFDALRLSNIAWKNTQERIAIALTSMQLRDDRPVSRRAWSSLVEMPQLAQENKRPSETDDFLDQVGLVAGARNKLYRQLFWAVA